jgi:hypothetical protein
MIRLPPFIKRFISRFKGKRHVARLQAELTLDRALALLSENLTAWEGEEDSVADEHADLITETRAFLFNARAA